MNLVGYVKNPAAIRCPEYSNASYTNIGDLSDDSEVSCGKDPVGDKKECKEKECHGTLYGNKK